MRTSLGVAAVLVEAHRAMRIDDATIALEQLIRAGVLSPADRREIEAHLTDSSDATTVIAVVQHLRMQRPRAKA
jgi:hypothetical protein